MRDFQSTPVSIDARRRRCRSRRSTGSSGVPKQKRAIGILPTQACDRSVHPPREVWRDGRPVRQTGRRRIRARFPLPKKALEPVAVGSSVGRGAPPAGADPSRNGRGGSVFRCGAAEPGGRDRRAAKFFRRVERERRVARDVRACGNPGSRPRASGRPAMSRRCVGDRSAVQIIGMPACMPRLSASCGKLLFKLGMATSAMLSGVQPPWRCTIRTGYIAPYNVSSAARWWKTWPLT